LSVARRLLYTGASSSVLLGINVPNTLIGRADDVIE